MQQSRVRPAWPGLDLGTPNFEMQVGTQVRNWTRQVSHAQHLTHSHTHTPSGQEGTTPILEMRKLSFHPRLTAACLVSTGPSGCLAPALTPSAPGGVSWSRAMSVSQKSWVRSRSCRPPVLCPWQAPVPLWAGSEQVEVGSSPGAHGCREGGRRRPEALGLRKLGSSRQQLPCITRSHTGGVARKDPERTAGEQACWTPGQPAPKALHTSRTQQSPCGCLATPRTSLTDAAVPVGKGQEDGREGSGGTGAGRVPALPS